MNKFLQMKYALLLSSVFLSLVSWAQPTALDDMLNAEKAFAAYSVTHGTREAFLKFLDSSAVVFESGKAVNGIETWTKKPTGKGLLNWHPVYGFVAASGDLGFTTGPWTFQPKTQKDSIAARGQYSTVWRKAKDSAWKAVVDLGVDATPSFDAADVVFGNEELKFVRGTWNNLLNREQKFIVATGDAGGDERRKRYIEAVSNQACIVARNGKLPAKSKDEITNSIATLPVLVNYHILGSGISAAGDLGYIYGSTAINGKADNYLRIWRREGKEWKLALEVLRY